MPDEPSPQSSIILYQTEDGRTRIQCRFEDETLWLTQAQIAELFQTTPQNVTLHLKAIFAEGELLEAATCKDYLQVRSEGSREVSRQLRHYRLEANRIVNLYIEYAELRALERKPMTMRDWITKLDEFLKISGRDLLGHAGKISAEQAKAKAELEYDRYRKLADVQPRPVDAAFEQAVKQLPKSAPKPRRKKP